MKYDIRITIIYILCIAFTGLLPEPGAANDTSLNLEVSPPRMLEEGETPIRMMSEHIVIHFGQPRTAVEVEFRFRNTADYPVSCWAGFPDEDLQFRYIWQLLDSGTTEEELLDRYDLDMMYIDSEISGDIQNFTAWTRPADKLDGPRTPLPYQLLRIESLASTITPEEFPAGNWSPAPHGSLLFCRAFELSLDAGQEVVVGHSYDATTAGNVELQSLFQYQLVTGSNWAGTIGEAVIDVFLEPSLGVSELFFGSKNIPEFPTVTRPGRAELKPVAPAHYRAIWRDFEPADDRGWIYLVTAPTWEMMNNGDASNTEAQ